MNYILQNLSEQFPTGPGHEVDDVSEWRLDEPVLATENGLSGLFISRAAR